MTKLFQTGGFDPLEPGYETPVSLEYEGISAGDLDAMLDFAASSAPAASAPPRGVTAPGAFERGRVDFERVRREHPIDEVAARILEGFKYKGPTSAVAACPYHGDDAAHANLHLSYGPNPRSGTFICSSCKAHGDVLDLVGKVMGFASTREALDFLDGGRPLPDDRREEMRRRAEENARRAALIPALNVDLREFAREAYNCLRKTSDHPTSRSPQARAYLASRGLEEAVARYRLGFVPKSFDVALLPKSWDHEEERVVPSLGFMGRVVIPYVMADGSVPLVNARPLIDRKPKYLKPSAGGRPSAAQPFLLAHAAARALPIVICEGEFDAMSLGISAGDLVSEVAIPGVNCFKETDAELLAGHRVILVTDNDAAGRRAAGPIRDLIEAYADSVVTAVVPGPHKDVNDLLRASGKAGVREWIGGVVGARRAVRFA